MRRDTTGRCSNASWVAASRASAMRRRSGEALNPKCNPKPQMQPQMKMTSCERGWGPEWLPDEACVRFRAGHATMPGEPPGLAAEQVVAKERAPSATGSRRPQRQDPSPQGGTDAVVERERTIPGAGPRRRSAADHAPRFALAAVRIFAPNVGAFLGFLRRWAVLQARKTLPP